MLHYRTFIAHAAWSQHPPVARRADAKAASCPALDLCTSFLLRPKDQCS